MPLDASQPPSAPSTPIKPSLDPIGSPAPAGYAAPAVIQSHHAHERTALADLASRVLHDPLLCQQLTDRVYNLMLEDGRQQRERSRSYGELL